MTCGLTAGNVVNFVYFSVKVHMHRGYQSTDVETRAADRLKILIVINHAIKIFNRD